MKSITLRLTKEQKDRAKACAKKENRSLNSFFVNAIMDKVYGSQKSIPEIAAINSKEKYYSSYSGGESVYYSITFPNGNATGSGINISELASMGDDNINYILNESSFTRQSMSQKLRDIHVSHGDKIYSVCNAIVDYRFIT